jgi:hypothetical protein
MLTKSKNKFDNYIAELKEEADKIECQKLDIIFDSCPEDGRAEKALAKSQLKSLQNELDHINGQIKILEKARAQNILKKAIAA